MMKTKLKTMIGALRPDTGKGNRVQPKFTLRKFFAVCLLAMSAQVGMADPWNSDHSIATFDFSASPFTDTGYSITYGFETKKINGFGLNQITSSGFENMFATQGAFTIHSSKLYNGNSGSRYLTISNLYQNVKITITYENGKDNSAIVFVAGNQVYGVSANQVLTNNQEYTMSSDGELDLGIGREVHIQRIVINYGTTRHISFDGATSSGFVNNMPYYRYRLSTTSRNFLEPTPTVFPSYSGTLTYLYKIENYDTSVGQKEVAVDPNYSTISDIMFKNLGWCKVTVIAKDGDTEVARGSYLVEVWDNEAYYVIDNNANGIPYKYSFAKDPKINDDSQQGGVLKDRTVKAIPGIEVKFSVAENGNEPNTVVVQRNTTSGEHMVSFANDNRGWWDRYPNDNWTSPSQGTFYSFTATASGKLKFGGVKINGSNPGTVYLVKLVNDNGTLLYPKAFVYTSSQSGYLNNSNLTSVTYSTHNEGTEQNPVWVSDASYYSISTDGIELRVGETYFLQGEAKAPTQNDPTQAWSPFLLEWFSYETNFNLSETFAVASKQGQELTSSETITTTALATLNGTALADNQISEQLYYRGNIKSADLELVNGYITFTNIQFKDGVTNDQKGGAIKAVLMNGSDTREFVLTIPYGKHVWDFRDTGNMGSRTTDDQADYPTYTNAEQCTMMKSNTTDWTRSYRVHSKVNGAWTSNSLKVPLMTAGSPIAGNNAFYISNTAGLVFITAEAESFGAEETDNNTENYEDLTNDQKYELKYTSTTATSLVWMKGTSTLYFPGVKANDYIKIYSYRHADDKGERFYVRNLVDLDGKSYNQTNATNFIRLRGATDEAGGGVKGDDIGGAAIFRVPSTYTDADNGSLATMPSLTLCDDGWTKIYRIEVMANYEPDLVLAKDCGTPETENDMDAPVDIVGFVTYDSRYGSVVLRKKGSTVTPVTNYYLSTSANIRAQHANTPKYQVIPDAGVTVNAYIYNWYSGREVDYNRLKLVFSSGNGNVRIIQREVANQTGSAVLVGHTGSKKDNNIANNSPITLNSSETGLATGDYVIDKKEYRIAVGELTVQDYPYTWDFTKYNFGNSTTQSNMNGSSSSNSWQWTGTWPSKTLTATGTKKMGENVTNDPEQELSLDVPMFAQGADMKAKNGSTTTVIAECEGLGISQPLAATQKNIKLSGNSNLYDVYNTSATISLGGSDDSYKMTNAGTVTIPEVGQNFYIFVKASAAPSSVKAGETTLTRLTGNDDIFSVQSGVYLYKQTVSGSQDVEVTFAPSTNVEIVAVTDIVKEIGPTGYATESRDCAIDHSYQSKLTTHPVYAYGIEEYDGTYNYKGFPQVKKSWFTLNTVPAKNGVLLFEDQNTHDANGFNSPLFVPAVNNTSLTQDQLNYFRNDNWLAPSVNWNGTNKLCSEGVHFYNLDTTIKKHIAKTGENVDNDVDCEKFILTNVYYTYYKDDGHVTGQHTANTVGFYRLKVTGSGATEDILGGNKAYLLVPKANLPLALWNGGDGEGVAGRAREGIIYIDLEDLEKNDATVIDNAIIESSKEDNVYYSISGARIYGKPTTKGFYIHSGKKVSVK